MSVIVASGAQICNSPVNRSVTKQMYSFPKAERFPKVKIDPSPLCYDIPSQRSKRYATMGVGGRTDFTRMQKGNNSQFYNNGTDFDKNHPYSPAYTFGLGRDKFEKVYVESAKYVDKSVPGPGKYYTPKPFGSDAPKFSLRGKPTVIRYGGLRTRKGEPLKPPGPGEYKNVYAINGTGKYAMSNLPNVYCFNYGLGKGKRFDYRCKLFLFTFFRQPKPRT